MVGLVTVMGVLEVVLLAGPAFAVGARRQRRSLALMAATGAEPAHVRRVVLAQGLWTGVAAVVLGVPLGLLVAVVGRAPLERYGDATFGPFDVAPLELGLVALLAAGTALLAALLPAWVMSRQPVVAALTGRRVTSAGAGRPALLGLVLLGTGLALTAGALGGYGRYGTYAEVGIAAAAIPTVLGAVLLAPAALALVGRLAGRLPLVLRFAVRDADRQRGRTAPAVAAIAATVAGVVALGTAASSDAAQNREQYRPSGPPGVGIVTAYGQDTDYAALREATQDALPGARVRDVPGLAAPTYGTSGFTELQVCRVGEQPQDGRCYELSGDYSSAYGSDVLVGSDGLDVLDGYVSEGTLRTARDRLAAGSVLLTGPQVRAGEQVELRLTRFEVGQDGRETASVLSRVTASAVPLQTGSPAAVRAVLPESLADDLGGSAVVGLAVGQDLTRAQERTLSDAVADVDEAVSVRVERGYEDTADRTVVLVLYLVAGVLVLAGTLAATSLALSEARPDLVTLGQVGARPRTRRLVAGGYALVLGVVGAVLGVAAGLVPGIAVSVPLTRDSSVGYSSVGGSLTALTDSSFVLDLPWGLLLLVLVVLPLVSAGVSAAAARGRTDGARRVVA